MSTSRIAVLTVYDDETHASGMAGTHLRELVRAEYREMPGLNVTLAQAARLWGLDVETSEQLLAGLVEDGFLVCDARGAYRRRNSPL